MEGIGRMNKKILIADDEMALRFLLSETLVDEGYQVEQTEDGQKAVERLQIKTYDLIILDYMMPEKTGVEVCSWLRQTSNPNQHTPVILLTAKAQEKDRQMALESGVNAYVTKPFSPLKFIEVIEEVLAG